MASVFAFTVRLPASIPYKAVLKVLLISVNPPNSLFDSQESTSDAAVFFRHSDIPRICPLYSFLSRLPVRFSGSRVLSRLPPPSLHEDIENLQLPLAFVLSLEALPPRIDREGQP